MLMPVDRLVSQRPLMPLSSSKVAAWQKARRSRLPGVSVAVRWDDGRSITAVAGVAKGSVLLLVLGLAISIPLVIFGATMLMKLMERFPIIITAGAGILGWVAGEMLVTDPSIVDGIKENMAWMHLHTPMGEVSWAQILGVVIVIAVGKWLASRKEQEGNTTEVTPGH